VNKSGDGQEVPWRGELVGAASGALPLAGVQAGAGDTVTS
jgi:hypothetical protein